MAEATTGAKRRIAPIPIDTSAPQSLGPVTSPTKAIEASTTPVDLPPHRRMHVDLLANCQVSFSTLVRLNKKPINKRARPGGGSSDAAGSSSADEGEDDEDGDEGEGSDDGDEAEVEGEEPGSSEDDEEDEDEEGQEGEDKEEEDGPSTDAEAVAGGAGVEGGDKTKALEVPRRRRVANTRYEADFIDDSDITRLDKPVAKAAHQGFFINKGEVDMLQEPRGQGGAAAAGTQRKQRATRPTAQLPAAGTTVQGLGQAPAAAAAAAATGGNGAAPVKRKRQPAGQKSDTESVPKAKKSRTSKVEAGSSVQPLQEQAQPQAAGNNTALQLVSKEPAAAAAPGKDKAGAKKPTIAQLAAMAGKVAGSGKPSLGVASSAMALSPGVNLLASATQRPEPKPVAASASPGQPGALTAAPSRQARTAPALAAAAAQLPGVNGSNKQDDQQALISPPNSPTGVRGKRKPRSLTGLTGTLSKLKLKLEAVMAVRASGEGGSAGAPPLRLSQIKVLLQTLALCCYREGGGEGHWLSTANKAVEEVLGEGRAPALACDAANVLTELQKQVDETKRSAESLKAELKKQITEWSTSAAGGDASLPDTALTTLDKLLYTSRRLCCGDEAAERQALLADVASWDLTQELKASSLSAQLDALASKGKAKPGVGGNCGPTARGSGTGKSEGGSQHQPSPAPKGGGLSADEDEEEEEQQKATQAAAQPRAAAGLRKRKATALRVDTQGEGTSTSLDVQAILGGAASRPAAVPDSPVHLTVPAGTCDAAGKVANTGPGARMPASALTKEQEQEQRDQALAQVQQHAGDVEAAAADLDKLSTFDQAIFKAACWLGPGGGRTREVGTTIAEHNMLPGWSVDDTSIARINRHLSKPALSSVVVHIGDRKYSWKGFPGVEAKPKPTRAGRDMTADPSQPATQHVTD